jgi:hypothetical protein
MAAWLGIKGDLAGFRAASPDNSSKNLQILQFKSD